jgi:hypothetical protein
MKKLLLAFIITSIGITIGFYLDRNLYIGNPPTFWLIGWLSGLISGMIIQKIT